ncbi:hypothetical protein Tco_0773208 [Tanacetum coccineum]|uniref:Uncharacterized protein n=1 Tax=Tanacetum coccineum TaxID=301880 RepID=A0ABQ4ZL34_9ASTR
MTNEGIVIHMLVKNKYPLKKEVLSQLLKLKLETEEDSTMALELIRFVKKQTVELNLKTLMEMRRIFECSLPKTINPTELDVAVLLKRQVADEDG